MILLLLSSQNKHKNNPPTHPHTHTHTHTLTLTPKMATTSTTIKSHYGSGDNHYGSTTVNYGFSLSLAASNGASGSRSNGNGNGNGFSTTLHQPHLRQQPGAVGDAPMFSSSSNFHMPMISDFPSINGGDLVVASENHHHHPTEDVPSNILFEAGRFYDGIEDNHHHHDGSTSVVTPSSSFTTPTINFHQTKQSMLFDLEPTPIAPFGVKSFCSPPPNQTKEDNSPLQYHHQYNPYLSSSSSSSATAAVQNLQSLEALRNLLSEQQQGERSSSGLFSQHQVQQPTTMISHGQIHHPGQTLQQHSSRLDERAVPNFRLMMDHQRHQMGSTASLSSKASGATSGSAAFVSDSDTSSTTSTAGGDNNDDTKDRFRCYQNCQWESKFSDLVVYHAKHGHCLVPHNYEDQSLAQWVKRQRYQYKLMVQGKHSTIDKERKAKLDDLGFIFDSHSATWEEKFQALLLFKEHNGHCNVPSKYEDKSLAIWVKCQRRQMKLRLLSQQSAMTRERIDRLNSVGFVFNPRNL